MGSGSPTYTPAGLSYGNDSGVMIQNNVQVSTPGIPDYSGHGLQRRVRFGDPVNAS